MKNQLFNFLLLVTMIFAVNTVKAQADQPTKIAKKVPTETVRTAPDHREKAVNQEERLNKINRKRAASNQHKIERKRPTASEGSKAQKTKGEKKVHRQPRLKANNGKLKKANGNRRVDHPGKGKALGHEKVKENKTL